MRSAIFLVFAVVGYAAARPQFHLGPAFPVAPVPFPAPTFPVAPVPFPAPTFPLAPVPLPAPAPVAPAPVDPVNGPFRIVPAVTRNEARDPSGQYAFDYVSADGGAQSSYGVLKPNPGGKGHYLAVTGSYSYTSPDGKPVYVTYIADDQGFRAMSDSIPQQAAA